MILLRRVRLIHFLLAFRELLFSYVRVVNKTQIITQSRPYVSWRMTVRIPHTRELRKYTSRSHLHSSRVCLHRICVPSHGIPSIAFQNSTQRFKNRLGLPVIPVPGRCRPPVHHF